METLVGYVTSVVYANEQNGYMVVRISTEEFDKPIVATGFLIGISENVTCEFQGLYQDHPKFGLQFQIEHYRPIIPTDRGAVIRYLSSSIFEGIGPKMAEKIVDTIEDDVLETIRNHPSSLDLVKGLKDETKHKLVEQLRMNDTGDEAIQFFLGHGLGLKDVTKIVALYKKDALDVIHHNPYVLIESIDGIGFSKIDQFARNIGFDLHSQERIEAIIIYSIKKLCFDQNRTFILSVELVDSLMNQFALSQAIIMEAIEELLMKKKLVREQDYLFDYTYYIAEVSTASIIASRLLNELNEMNLDVVNDAISSFQDEENIIYDIKQREAIHMFIKSPLMILTGGPGTGKTTVVKAIIKIYQHLYKDQRIAIVAPTGRAAKRIYELTGVQAFTIHSLLKWDLHSNHYGMNQDNPLDYDVLIVDEFSMVDVQLFYRLLDASYFIKKMLFIGDPEQLPPVSPGNTLEQLLATDVIPTTELNVIFRQKEMSGIVALSQCIRLNQDIDQLTAYSDLVFKDCPDQVARQYLLSYVEKALIKGYEVDEIQVLSPMYSGTLGIDQLNVQLQSLFNPSSSDKRELKVGHRIYREGDKILQLKNRPDDGVFNGDIGLLVEVVYKHETIEKKDRLIVAFDDILIEYTSADFITLTHAFCLSVHKAQGNEFKIVVLPISKSHTHMLSKSLIYTGVSRAKQSLIMIGSMSTFLQGTKHIIKTIDNSCLATRIKDYVYESDF